MVDAFFLLVCDCHLLPELSSKSITAVTSGSNLSVDKLLGMKKDVKLGMWYTEKMIKRVMILQS